MIEPRSKGNGAMNWEAWNRGAGETPFGGAAKTRVFKGEAPSHPDPKQDTLRLRSSASLFLLLLGSMLLW